ncbi:MAG: glutathione synthase [Alphaproteobacteria bacterium]
MPAIAIQMDPLETIEIDVDTSFIMGIEAQKRGYQLYHYQPKDMVFDCGVLKARARPVVLRQEMGNHFSVGAPELVELDSMAAIFMRQDPPFDLAYITATHLLEYISHTTLVVNDPAAVRNAPEKLFVNQFPEIIPPTMISWDIEAIKEFRAEHGDIIIKPIYSFSGRGVFRLRPEDQNLQALLELFAQTGREPLVVQKFIHQVSEGDKRVILIDGKAVGCGMRIPAKGEVRANIHAGGRPASGIMTPRDYEICEVIGSSLRQQGLILTGIDIIGGYLTEINVTSPGMLQEISGYVGKNLEIDLLDVIEEKIHAQKLPQH